MSATLLAQAIAALDPGATFAGIGGERMRRAKFSIWFDSTGWGSMGPLAAVGKIPKLYATMWRAALRIARERPGLVVLVDFGAFNLRLAKTLRFIGFRGPILYFFPPGAWLDNSRQARAVCAWTTPLVAFEHQRAFYESLGLPVSYFGHPLVSAYAMRERPVPARKDGGTVALLPGSRSSERRYHLPLLLEALRLLRAKRPALRGVVGASDDRAYAAIERELQRRNVPDVEMRHSGTAALDESDAAWIASGTAVLEAALCGVPTVALYVMSRAQARVARRVYRGTYVTIPNLVSGREIVPEFLQEDATPQALAAAMDATLADPQKPYAGFAALRAGLGPSDALARCAAFAIHEARR